MAGSIGPASASASAPAGPLPRAGEHRERGEPLQALLDEGGRLNLKAGFEGSVDHSGWRLASKKKLQGDNEGRKRLKDAEKLLDKLIADYAGTPWEILARREKMTALGLEWKAN